MYFEFEKQNDNPEKAKWRFVALGAVTILLLLGLSVRSVIPSIEKDIAERVTNEFLANDISNTLITVSGRDLIIEGLVTQSDYTKILELTNSINGIRVVKNNLTLVEQSPKGKKNN